MVAGASFCARLSVLFTLLAGSVALDAATYHTLAYALAVTTATQVLIDPGTSSYFAARRGEVALARSDWQSGLLLQAGVNLIGLGIVFSIGLGTAGVGSTFKIFSPLAVLAAAESTIRYARVVWQVGGRFGGFATVDGAISVVRGATAIVLGLSGVAAFGVANLVGAGVLICVVTPFAARAAAARGTGARPSLRFLVLRVWPYGASTSVAALYSQLPAVMIGIFGSLSQAAIYSIAARMTQPSELIPSSIAAVYLPKLSRSGPGERAVAFRREARLAAAAGLLTAAVLCGASPVLMRVFHATAHRGIFVLIILAIVLPLKFLNYQYVALALSQGRVRSRLVMSLLVGVVAVVAIPIVAVDGAAAVAAVALSCESALLVGLVFVTRAELRGRVAWSTQ